MTLRLWQDRNLSLIGKVLVANMPTASLLTYKMSVLLKMPKEIIRMCEVEFQKFLWNCRKPKIAYKKTKCAEA